MTESECATDRRRNAEDLPPATSDLYGFHVRFGQFKYS